MNSAIVAVLACAVVSGSSLASAGQGTRQAPDSSPVQTVPVEVTQISGDFYPFRAGAEVSVMAVMPDSIVIADPLSRGAVRTLASELRRLFPNHPVRFVVLTSHRFERAEGAQLFAKAAE